MNIDKSLFSNFYSIISSHLPPIKISINRLQKFFFAMLVVFIYLYLFICLIKNKRYKMNLKVFETLSSSYLSDLSFLRVSIKVVKLFII